MTAITLGMVIGKLLGYGLVLICWWVSGPITRWRHAKRARRTHFHTDPTGSQLPTARASIRRRK
jgi:hypothetical protein